MRTLTLVGFVATCVGCFDPVWQEEPVALDAGSPAVADAGTTPCSPSTCSGCCLGARCVEGTSDQACGRQGSSCDVCLHPARCEAMGLCVVRNGPLQAATPTDGGTSIPRGSGDNRPCAPGPTGSRPC